MPKFKSGEFVHVGSHGGEIMLVYDVDTRNPVMTRYGLEKIDGTLYNNIGEYELTEATDDEVEAKLDARDHGLQ